MQIDFEIISNERENFKLELRKKKALSYIQSIKEKTSDLVNKKEESETEKVNTIANVIEREYTTQIAPILDFIKRLNKNDLAELILEEKTKLDKIKLNKMQAVQIMMTLKEKLLSFDYDDSISNDDEIFYICYCFEYLYNLVDDWKEQFDINTLFDDTLTKKIMNTLAYILSLSCLIPEFVSIIIHLLNELITHNHNQAKLIEWSLLDEIAKNIVFLSRNLSSSEMSLYIPSYFTFINNLVFLKTSLDDNEVYDQEESFKSNNCIIKSTIQLLSSGNLHLIYSLRDYHKYIYSSNLSLLHAFIIESFEIELMDICIINKLFDYIKSNSTLYSSDSIIKMNINEMFDYLYIILLYLQYF